MHTRLLGMLALLVLLTAACTDDAADEAAPQDPEVETEVPAADLDDDTAAEVNTSAIPRAAVEERIDDAVAADDELAAQVEGEEGEQLLDMFRAQTLTVLIQTRVILDGAAEMGVEPSGEDVAAARQELVDELGGEAELEDAMAQAGLSEEALADQLQGVAALDAVGDHLVEQGEVEEAPEAPEGAEELDPADLAVQQWLAEQMAAAEVAVHPEFGQWDPRSGQVVPAGGPVLPETPEAEPPPDQ